MHNGTQIYDVILSKELQEHLTKITAKMVSLIKKNKNGSRKENGQTEIIMFRIMLTLNTKM